MTLHLKTTIFAAIEFERLFSVWEIGRLIVSPQKNWLVKLDGLAYAQK